MREATWGVEETAMLAPAEGGAAWRQVWEPGGRLAVASDRKNSCQAPEERGGGKATQGSSHGQDWHLALPLLQALSPFQCYLPVFLSLGWTASRPCWRQCCTFLSSNRDACLGSLHQVVT